MTKLESIFANFQNVNYQLDRYCFNLCDDYEDIEEYFFEFDFSVLDVGTIDDSGTYMGTIEFNVIARPFDDSDEETICMDLSGKFIGNPDYFETNKDFTKMLTINGLLFLSQIARSHILSATSCIGLPEPILLPMLNIMELIQEKYENE